MFKYLLFSLLFISPSFSQVDNNVEITSQNGEIFLFGESHFVKEKYDEMKLFIMERLKTVSAEKKVTIFFELPYSLNYAISKIKLENDTSVFLDWFNHLYKRKEKKPSFFWTDYRDFILTLLQFSKKNGIDLQLKCIDIELEFRRTAYILSSFENKLDSEIDDFLKMNYIKNDSINREFLLNYVNKLLSTTNNPYELEILNKLKKSLLIDCTICRKREHFMYNNFIQYYDSSDAMVFGAFGLDHVINTPDFSSINNFFKFNNKVDTVGHKSLYNFIKNDFKDKIYRIGIIALKQNMRLSNLQKMKDYSHLMSKNGRKYIETLLKDKKVVRIYPYKHKVLSKLSLNLNYLIIYKSSNFRY